MTSLLCNGYFLHAGDIDRLFFRSDNDNLDGSTGFTAVVQCFNPQDENLEGMYAMSQGEQLEPC